MSSIRSLLLFFVLSLFLSPALANFSAENFISGFQKQESSLSSTEKKVYYGQVHTTLRLLALQYRDDAEQVKVFSLLQDYVDTKIDTLSGSTEVVPFSGMTIPRVDLAKVRDVWLSLHNAERTSAGLSPFIYSTALEGTASVWASHLAAIRTTTHRRKSTDRYYSYESIKSWFLNQGIVFAAQEANGQSLFSENIGWNMYSCKKDDCTDDFIKAIKKSRSFFMSEKGKRYKPHYNAIVGNFTTIGLGVALSGNKYYLVSHYTQSLK